MQINGFGSTKHQSAWAQAEAWRAKRSQMAQQFLSEWSAISSAITSAQVNLSTGLATLTAETLIQRLHNEGQAKKSGVNLTI